MDADLDGIDRLPHDAGHFLQIHLLKIKQLNRQLVSLVQTRECRVYVLVTVRTVKFTATDVATQANRGVDILKRTLPPPLVADGGIEDDPVEPGRKPCASVKSPQVLKRLYEGILRCFLCLRPVEQNLVRNGIRIAFVGIDQMRIRPFIAAQHLVDQCFLSFSGDHIHLDAGYNLQVTALDGIYFLYYFAIHL